MNRFTHLGLSMIGCLALVASGTAQAQDVTVLSATRGVSSQAFGYDWDFYGGEQDGDASNATFGVFAYEAYVDLQEWYGGQVGTGIGSIDSDISAAGIFASWDLYAACIDTGVYQGDAAAYGDLDATFDVTSRVRARVIFEAFCYGTYSFMYASLRNTGTNQQVLNLSIFSDDDGSSGVTTWLQPGTYNVQSDAECGAWGTYGTDDESSAVVNISVEFFKASDFNADGIVDTADRSAFLANFNAGLMTADFDGNGVVNSTDKNLFLKAWRAQKGT